jgi:hypothetical protein
MQSPLDPPPRRKQYGLRIAIDLMQEVKHLAVDEQKALNDLVEEGLRELLKKYRRRTPI